MAPPGPDVGVVVVSWNTRDLLAECLRTLEPEVRAGRAEVCVVDNASTDGSAELVRDEFGWARLVAAERNLGFGPAANRGAAGTAARWIAIANADVALTPGALEALVAAGDADPRAGAVAPRLVLPGGAVQLSAFPFPTLAGTVAFSVAAQRATRRFAAAHGLVEDGDERPRPVPWAVAAFVLVRREAWERLGGFDEQQWMYAEDLDLGWRLREAGWRTVLVPAARVHHHSGASAEQAWGADGQIARQQRSTYAWMLRRRGQLRTRATALVSVAAAGVRWGAFAAAARVRREPWAYRRDLMRTWTRAHAQGLERASALREHR